MKILRSIGEFRNWRNRIRPREFLGFVPTMGALHAGHASLIERAIKENDRTVVSIFVNPTQFGPKEDFTRYPRTLADDCSLLKRLGVAAVFAPSVKTMYPQPPRTKVSVSGLNEVLCGAPASRGKAHFDAVATVVAKLFNIVRPHRAYFGMKDFQQIRVIEQMTNELNFDIKIVRCPTIRAKDGLALSSRNCYLKGTERGLAGQLFQALQLGRKLLTSSRKKTVHTVVKVIQNNIEKIPQITIEYIELVDPQTLAKLSIPRRPALVAVAVHLGTTRLIDNILVK